MATVIAWLFLSTMICTLACAAWPGERIKTTKSTSKEPIYFGLQALCGAALRPRNQYAWNRYVVPAAMPRAAQKGTPYLSERSGQRFGEELEFFASIGGFNRLVLVSRFRSSHHFAASSFANFGIEEH